MGTQLPNNNNHKNKTIEEEIERLNQKTELLSRGRNSRTRAENDNPTVENEALDVPDKLSKFELNRTTDELRSGLISGAAQ